MKFGAKLCASDWHETVPLLRYPGYQTGVLITAAKGRLGDCWNGSWGHVSELVKISPRRPARTTI